jgi:hypothetical protein
MKLLQERFYVFISLLVTVVVFAFIISNFPVKEGNHPEPGSGSVADASVHNQRK